MARFRNPTHILKLGGLATPTSAGPSNLNDTESPPAQSANGSRPPPPAASPRWSAPKRVLDSMRRIDWKAVKSDRCQTPKMFRRKKTQVLSNSVFEPNPQRSPLRTLFRFFGKPRCQLPASSPTPPLQDDHLKTPSIVLSESSPSTPPRPPPPPPPPPPSPPAIPSRLPSPLSPTHHHHHPSSPDLTTSSAPSLSNSSTSVNTDTMDPRTPPSHPHDPFHRGGEGVVLGGHEAPYVEIPIAVPGLLLPEDEEWRFRNLARGVD